MRRSRRRYVNKRRGEGNRWIRRSNESRVWVGIFRGSNQLDARKDFESAFKVMATIIGLIEKHNLELPDEFHFRYARIALSADSVRTALESMNRYLEAAGRMGEFYKEALALSVQAEEELAAPEINAEDTCARKQRGAECWLELANHPGCYVWKKMDRRVYDSVTWSGECTEQVALGKGTLNWIDPDEGDRTAISRSRRLRKGKPHGYWVERNSYGYGPAGA